jgi:hypothetical protein
MVCSRPADTNPNPTPVHATGKCPCVVASVGNLIFVKVIAHTHVNI